MSLAKQAAHAAHGIELLLGFNTLGDDLHAEGVAEVNHGFENRSLTAIRGSCGDELGRDFDDVDGETGQVVEGREAGAEVIDGDAYPAGGHALKDGRGDFRIAVQSSLGDLEEEARRIDRIGEEGLFQLGDHLRVVELALGEVEREGEVEIGSDVRPLEQLAADGVHGFAAECDREACIFCHAEQFKEAVNGAIGAAETEQGFETFESS